MSESHPGLIHTMELPRRVIIGKGVISSLSDTCRSLGFEDELAVLTGQRTFEIIGKTVVARLEEAGFNVHYLLVKDAKTDTATVAESELKDTGSQIIVGIGGGKVIDIAKSVSNNLSIQYLSVPTVASHDGIASPYASLRDGNQPYSVKTSAPLAIIADLDVIGKSSYRLTASGCGDIISKFTAVRDWWLASYIKNEYFGDYAAELSLLSAKLISQNAELIRSNQEEGIRIVVEALISCGVAASIAGSSRPCSGSEHLFSHALDRIAEKPGLHGEQCGIGTIMMAFLHRLNWRKIRDVLRCVGAPSTAAELGVSDDDIVEALSSAHKVRPNRYTILGENGLSREKAMKIAKTTGVIG